MDSNVETFDPVIHYTIALLDSASVQWLRYPKTKAEKELKYQRKLKAVTWLGRILSVKPNNYRSYFIGQN